MWLNLTPFIQFLFLLSLKIWNCYNLMFALFFLNGDLDEEIFMVQLEGFQVLRTKSKVCKLFKCFYGLCQASHA
jgi:hypothetical protein